jgi:acyl-CoA dehydrogenase
MNNINKLYPANFKKLNYTDDPMVKILTDFFEAKGLEKLKAEDRAENWYADFCEYVKEHKIYARFLSPKKYSTKGNQFDFLSLCRYLESFAYFSPAHAYSFQVSFLGIFPILMSKNEQLKKEAIQRLENGAMFAFGLSEKGHGSDIYSSEMTLTREQDQFVANGAKYYIGNANCAEMISVLAIDKSINPGEKVGKQNFTFFALRPNGNACFSDLKKIETMGVRTAFVGGFSVKNHKFSSQDLIAQGDAAWDAVFGTVNLGKYFLGFGSVGICEHAMTEAYAHVTQRILFGQPVFEMPHIKKVMAAACVKLLGMKLFAYRAIDYLQVASTKDRRYLLINSVQKAKVSTEGVGVMQMLSECIGAKGFEANTYFESALRDATLIPGLEGSTHINYGLTNIFLKKYFFDAEEIQAPAFHETTPENEYIFQAETGGLSRVAFPDYEVAYKELYHIPNVEIFKDQLAAFKVFLVAFGAFETIEKTLKQALKTGQNTQDAEMIMELGKLFCTIVYGQLIAEQATRMKLDERLISLIFHQLIEDLNMHAIKIASLPSLGEGFAIVHKTLIKRMIEIQKTKTSDIDAGIEILKRGFAN